MGWDVGYLAVICVADGSQARGHTVTGESNSNQHVQWSHNQLVPLNIEIKRVIIFWYELTWTVLETAVKCLLLIG